MNMMYAMSEDEYNAMLTTLGVLDFTNDLLCQSRPGSRLGYEASDLQSFIQVQVDAIRGVVKGVEKRHEAEKEPNNKLNWIDLTDIMQVMSGRNRRTLGQLKKLGQKLQNCVKADPSMEHVFRTWQDVMTDGGKLPFSLEPSSTDGYIIDFEVRVPTVVQPVPTVQAAHPAKASAPQTPRKREKLATIKPSTAEVACSQK
jgi:hypothetical protein